MKSSPREKYPGLIARALDGLPESARVLKTDAFNEARNLAPIFAQCPDAAVIDIAPDAIAQARANWPGADIRAGDIRAIPWGRDAFDLVIDLSTIDHVAEWRAALAEYNRVLKPGGRLLIVAWLNLEGGTVDGASAYGGRQYFIEARAFWEALAGFVRLEWTEVLTLPNLDAAGLALNPISAPFAPDIEAFFGRTLENGELL